MGANYKLVRNPSPTDSTNKQPLHPRMVAKGTVRINELMADAKGRSSLSPADIKGALQLLSDLMIEKMASGYNVELDGIGFFSVSLQSRPVMEKDEIRSNSVHFKKVNFQSCKKMKERLQALSLSRSKEVEKKPYPAEEREKRLIEYLEQKPYISRQTYMTLNQIGKNIALDDLKRFAKEGKIDIIGKKSTTIYTKVLGL